MPRILILNGPNLNLLGTRQPEVYGATTLADIEDMCRDKHSHSDVSLTFLQSNHEGVLIDAIHGALKDETDGIIINAGAYTHTSVAIMDAVASVQIPTIELHLSNIHAREAFRHTSYLAKVAIGQICGFGAYGYIAAIDAMLHHVEAQME
ncbi:MAG: type II 3-dehydroquinate dehydratase [Pseudoruegeria sp.]